MSVKSVLRQQKKKWGCAHFVAAQRITLLNLQCIDLINRIEGVFKKLGKCKNEESPTAFSAHKTEKERVTWAVGEHSSSFRTH